MCIGIPMRVLAVEPGNALCLGRGGQRRISTILVGECRAGDWLLVFLDSARERIDAARAAEIDATLDLLQAALTDQPAAAGEAAFSLPSAMTAEQLAALVGR
ncbi:MULTISPECIES: HypC/HybG/HupF family hydrogenase formation chaperone [Paraburkholderia]|uniref:HypC/HybG/HupF family hydrogenase formation chaperone n=3 Tax=Pseudomonadota TaxID=1224 RepID=A0A248VZS5_9BURK|nr:MULTISPECIES: HypC/HybG/HupF family hydrogenase formation chaperone [Paraburkholderia]ASW04022.1 HypC/HybG/HupF family hydrogenase formation chaperone [Paraburkholderia aromaticivorans]BAA13226.1 hupF [Pseudomonas hydrogenovora]CAB3738606.1 hypothetical protein LMG22037_06247 [Paraburkholderia phenoliruptrix]